jgi:hypothetical protein
MIKLSKGDDFMVKYTSTLIEELHKPETYTFKEILFGLRNEYLNITKQLNTLKQYLFLKENNLEDINITISKDCDSGAKIIVCFLIERKNKLQKLLYKIAESIDIYPEYKVDYIMETINGYSFANYDNLLDTLLKEEFSNAVLNIYNNEFVQNAQSIFYGTGYCGVPFLSVLPSHIYTIESSHLSIDYNPSRGDYLQVKSIKAKITLELLESSLNMTYPKRRVPNYYQDIIDNSPSIFKPIDIIGKIEGTKQIDLQIIEEPKRLILKKI